MKPEQALEALQSILEAVLPQMENGKFSNVQRHFMRALLDQFKSQGQIYADLRTSERHLKEAMHETENAANTILNLAETLQEDERTEEVGMQLAEVCAFQDIVGQRLKKVQNTLDRYGDFLAIMSVNPTTLASAADALMQGPGFQGEVISQDEADRLMR